MAQIYAPMSYTSLVAAVPFNLSGETLCVFCDPSGGAYNIVQNRSDGRWLVVATILARFERGVGRQRSP